MPARPGSPPVQGAAAEPTVGQRFHLDTVGEFKMPVAPI
jgi:hypothetical protein